MKNKYLSSVAGIALASIMAAAGSAQAQAPNWAGPYIGAFIGGAWGDSDATTTSNCSLTAFPPAYYCGTTAGAANGAAVDANGSGSLSGSGLTGGVLAGYNWQTNGYVYGAEADFGAFNISGSRQGSALYPSNTGPGPILAAAGSRFTVGSTFDTNWLATFRGRFGATLGNYLLFVSGGLAITNLEVTNSFSDNFSAPGARGSGSESKLKLGYILGGGIERMLGDQWTVRGEYIYVNFGDVTANMVIDNIPVGGGYAQALSTSSDLTAHIARIGVNRKF
jgi:outer membrane immunogenic protein